MEDSDDPGDGYVPGVDDVHTRQARHYRSRGQPTEDSIRKLTLMGVPKDAAQRIVDEFGGFYEAADYAATHDTPGENDRALRNDAHDNELLKIDGVGLKTVEKIGTYSPKSARHYIAHRYPGIEAVTKDLTAGGYEIDTEGGGEIDVEPTDDVAGTSPKLQKAGWAWTTEIEPGDSGLEADRTQPVTKGGAMEFTSRFLKWVADGFDPRDLPSQVGEFVLLDPDDEIDILNPPTDSPLIRYGHPEGYEFTVSMSRGRRKKSSDDKGTGWYINRPDREGARSGGYNDYDPATLDDALATIFDEMEAWGHADDGDEIETSDHVAEAVDDAQDDATEWPDPRNGWEFADGYNAPSENSVDYRKETAWSAGNLDEREAGELHGFELLSATYQNGADQWLVAYTDKRQPGAGTNGIRDHETRTVPTREQAVDVLTRWLDRDTGRFASGYGPDRAEAAEADDAQADLDESTEATPDVWDPTAALDEPAKEAVADGGQEYDETVVLVGCGQAKQEGTHKAKNLYTSHYFDKKRRYAELVGDRWYIVSAHHYILDPDEKIEDYDRQLTDSNATGWQKQAYIELNNRPSMSDARVIVLAGQVYLDNLDTWLDGRKTGTWEAPTQGMLVGERMSWLKDRIEEIEQQQQQDNEMSEEGDSYDPSEEWSDDRPQQGTLGTEDPTQYRESKIDEGTDEFADDRGDVYDPSQEDTGSQASIVPEEIEGQASLGGGQAQVDPEWQGEDADAQDADADDDLVDDQGDEQEDAIEKVAEEGYWNPSIIGRAFDVQGNVASAIMDAADGPGDLLKLHNNTDGDLSELPGIGESSARSISSVVPKLKGHGVTRHDDQIERWDDRDEWAEAVEYLRDHYGDDYGDRVEFTSDIGSFANENGVPALQALGDEGVTQPLLRYQDVEPADAYHQIEQRAGEDEAENIKNAIKAFADAGAARADDGDDAQDDDDERPEFPNTSGDRASAKLKVGRRNFALPQPWDGWQEIAVQDINKEAMSNRGERVAYISPSRKEALIFEGTNVGNKWALSAWRFAEELPGKPTPEDLHFGPSGQDGGDERVKLTHGNTASVEGWNANTDHYLTVEEVREEVPDPEPANDGDDVPQGFNGWAQADDGDTYDPVDEWGPTADRPISDVADDLTHPLEGVLAQDEDATVSPAGRYYADEDDGVSAAEEARTTGADPAEVYDPTQEAEADSGGESGETAADVDVPDEVGPFERHVTPPGRLKWETVSGEQVTVVVEQDGDGWELKATRHGNKVPVLSAGGHGADKSQMVDEAVDWMETYAGGRDLSEAQGDLADEQDDGDESNLYERLRDMGVPGNGSKALSRHYDTWAEIEGERVGEIFEISGVGAKAMEALVPSSVDNRSMKLTVEEARDRDNDDDGEMYDPTAGFDEGDRVEHTDGRTGTVEATTNSAVSVEYDESGDTLKTSPKSLTVVDDEQDDRIDDDARNGWRPTSEGYEAMGLNSSRLVVEGEDGGEHPVKVHLMTDSDGYVVGRKDTRSEAEDLAGRLVDEVTPADAKAGGDKLRTALSGVAGVDLPRDLKMDTTDTRPSAELDLPDRWERTENPQALGDPSLGYTNDRNSLLTVTQARDGDGWKAYFHSTPDSERYHLTDEATTKERAVEIVESFGRSKLHPSNFRASGEEIEFGSIDAANEFRDEHPDILHWDDTRRTKTVQFAPHAPDDVLDDAGREAMTSESQATKYGQAKLTDRERSQLEDRDGWTWGTHGFHAMSAKAILQKEGATPWLDYYQMDIEAEEHIGEAQQDQEMVREEGLTGKGETGMRDDSEKETAEIAKALDKGQGEMCQSARDACEDGEPEACDALLEDCGWSDDEIEGLKQAARDIGEEPAEIYDPAADADTGQPFEEWAAANEPAKPDTPDVPEKPAALDAPSDDELARLDPTPSDDSLPGPARRALKKAWSGYKLARVDTRKAQENAEKYAEIINGVRAVNGQDPLDFDTLDGWAGGEVMPDDPSETYPSPEGEQETLMEAIKHGHAAEAAQATLAKFDEATGGSPYDPTEDL